MMSKLSPCLPLTECMSPKPQFSQLLNGASKNLRLACVVRIRELMTPCCSAPYSLSFLISSVQCTMPGSYTQLHLVPAVTLGRSCYYSHPFLTEEETEAKRV